MKASGQSIGANEVLLSVVYEVNPLAPIDTLMKTLYAINRRVVVPAHHYIFCDLTNPTRFNQGFTRDNEFADKIMTTPRTKKDTVYVSFVQGTGLS